MRRLVCVGIIIGAHGIRGGVRIRSFTARPEDVGAYGPVWDERGVRCFSVQVFGLRGRGVVLADLDGTTSRSEAGRLRGMYLFVPRSALPELEDETFYWADLVGLEVLFPYSQSIKRRGCVRALHDFGAGPILEVSLEVSVANSYTMMLPFTRSTIPEVNVAQGWVRVSSASEIWERRDPLLEERDRD